MEHRIRRNIDAVNPLQHIRFSASTWDETNYRSAANRHVVRAQQAAVVLRQWGQHSLGLNFASLPLTPCRAVTAPTSIHLSTLLLPSAFLVSSVLTFSTFTLLRLCSIYDFLLRLESLRITHLRQDDGPRRTRSSRCVAPSHGDVCQARLAQWSSCAQRRVYPTEARGCPHLGRRCHLH